MTKIICGGRGNGKTIELIKMSAETRCPIVSPWVDECKRIIRIASELGLDIPDPVVFSYKGPRMHDRLRGSDAVRKGVLIDDIDRILGIIFNGAPIECVSFTVENEENLPEVTWLKNNPYVKGKTKGTMDIDVIFK